MAAKLSSKLITSLILPSCLLIFLYSKLLPLSYTPLHKPSIQFSPPCNLFAGHWVNDPTRVPIYDDTCPFHRNAWNCLRNRRDNMGRINSWKWVPEKCELLRIDPVGFLGLMRNKRIGFVGDSLNENFLVSLLCILRVGDLGGKKWKKKGAWRGAYFPKYNVTVGYHRAVLLAKYEQQMEQLELPEHEGVKSIYRVDVDIPAHDWADINDYYDVLIFNTGHWWGYDKFPKESPLVFFKAGRPILPPLGIQDGLKVVLENMVSHIQNKIPQRTLKFWRLQSPRHFHGGDWNQNGSCLFNEPLEEPQQQWSE